MLRNVELKARLEDLDAARALARQVATEPLGTQQQVDTYFHCPQGRLKLRQIDGRLGQLVWYARPDQPGPKASDYLVVPVSEPEKLKAALAAALGVLCVVRKRREIFLYHNVRIHLDEVEGLGSFLEFEAVLGSYGGPSGQPAAMLSTPSFGVAEGTSGPEVDEATGRGQLDELARQFGLDQGDLLCGSYADMIPQSTQLKQGPPL
jgi:adenylate cyclase class IV